MNRLFVKKKGIVMTTLLDRYTGTLVGVLAGDAAGAPYENMRAYTISADVLRRGGVCLFDYVDPWTQERRVEAGHPTDDAELTAAFAFSLSDFGMFDKDDVYESLRNFIHVRRSILTDGEAYGSGGTLRSALRAETYQLSKENFRTGCVRVVPSNGALMRNAPCALLNFPNMADAVETAREQSCITHIHPESQVACMVYTMLHMRLLHGDAPMEAWEKTIIGINTLIHAEGQKPDSVLRAALMRVSALKVTVRPEDEDIWPDTGGALISLRAAVWATLEAGDFIDGLTRVISLGGDVDTYGAIAGGLLGAHFGIEGIPHEWRAVLVGASIMEEGAKSLYYLTDR